MHNKLDKIQQNQPLTSSMSNYIFWHNKYKIGNNAICSSRPASNPICVFSLDLLMKFDILLAYLIFYMFSAYLKCMKSKAFTGKWAIHFSVVCMVTVVPLGEIEAIRLTKLDKDWKINVQTLDTNHCLKTVLHAAPFNRTEYSPGYALCLIEATAIVTICEAFAHREVFAITANSKILTSHCSAWMMCVGWMLICWQVGRNTEGHNNGTKQQQQQKIKDKKKKIQYQEYRQWLQCFQLFNIQFHFGSSAGGATTEQKKRPTDSLFLRTDSQIRVSVCCRVYRCNILALADNLALHLLVHMWPLLAPNEQNSGSQMLILSLQNMEARTIMAATTVCDVDPKIVSALFPMTS